jgi:hypothetical protein
MSMIDIHHINIYIKQLLKPFFETAYLGKILINLLKQKVAIILGYLIFSKNHNEPPKVKNRPICHSDQTDPPFQVLAP